MAETLSAGARQLLGEAAYCEIATLMPDGSPPIAQVWVDTDGDHVLINTMTKSQKVRNVRRDPRVAVMSSTRPISSVSSTCAAGSSTSRWTVPARRSTVWRRSA